MSIAVVVKVYDGVVLASDSAASIFMKSSGNLQSVLNVYNNADKIFNLSKGEPIGMISSGTGAIGEASISTLAKDLRNRFKNKDDELYLGDKYNIEKITTFVRKFFYEEKFQPLYHDAQEKPIFNFLIAGYSKDKEKPELWQILIKDGESSDPICLRGEDVIGINWSGEIETINRLIKGVGHDFPKALKELGVPDDQIAPAETKVSNFLERPMAYEGMPIKDAIDLAEFLVRTTIDFIRFSPGAPTVGGPIDIATITKHESFKWIKRKHFFDEKFNPKE